MNVTIINPNFTSIVDILIFGNQIIGAPYPTFFVFGMVLTISLILTFSLAQLFKWERAITVGGGIGLFLTLLLSLGGPQLMNIYYAALFTFFTIIGIWMTIKSKESSM
jgi:hypothetical protein